MRRRSRARSLLLAALVAVALAACSRSADDLLETARFEELQRNLPHARKLYQEIVDRFPDSYEAKEAKQRLAIIGAAGDGG
jgi:TolA-binding protein